MTESSSTRDPYVEAAAPRTESALRRRLAESEALYRTLAENAGVGIWQIDPRGHTIYANPAMLEMLEVADPGELADATYHRFFTEASIERMIARYGRRPAVRVSGFEADLVGARGARRAVVVSGAPVLDEQGAVTSYIGTFTDISDRKRAEDELERRVEERTAELQASEARWRSAVENSPDYVLIVGPDLRIQFINKTLPQYTVEGVIGTQLTDYVPSEYHDALLGYIEQVFTTGESVVYETPADGADGGTGWYSSRVGPVKRGDEVIAVMITGTDITERKRAEEALRASEAKYRAVVEHLPAITYVASALPRSAEHYVSPKIEEILGYTPEEWTSDPDIYRRTIHPDDRERVLAEEQRQFDESDGFDLEYRMIARDGTVRWVHDTAVRIKDESGNTLFEHGVAIDITDRKAALAELEETRARHAAMADLIPDMIFRVGRDGSYLGFKPSREVEPLRPVEELLGRTVRDVLPSEVAEAMMQSVERALKTGETQVFEYELPHPDGGQQPFEGRLVAAGDDEVLVIAREITERRRLERTILATSEREQSRIAQDLHDGLGQEMTGIAFMAKALHRKLADRGAPEADDAHKISDLVHDAITTTRRMARGLYPVRPDDDGLQTALEELAINTEIVFGTTCKVACTDEVVRDQATANHLFRIAQEAVTNAVKHGRAGRIEITLETADEGLVTLTVRDDGVGFPDQPAEGDGMGLRIMDHRARMIGASFDIRRDGDRGTVVSCKFRQEERPPIAARPLTVEEDR